VTYRRPDGTYDPAALAEIRRVMRSRDGGEGEISLRLVELLAHVYAERGKQPLRIQSGYRSPDYNEAIRARGAKAAGGSLHTEGLAADVSFTPKELTPFWLEIRKLDCCGAGYYQKNGFLHLDVGRPRFWEPATSKVEENLSAGNARIFARSEFDRYTKGETIVVALHALTLPPVLVAKDAVLSADGREQPPRRVVVVRGVRGGPPRRPTACDRGAGTAHAGYSCSKRASRASSGRRHDPTNPTQCARRLMRLTRWAAADLREAGGPRRWSRSYWSKQDRRGRRARRR
jgi:uncharacterized protein YcbK (DUF882 family)